MRAEGAGQVRTRGNHPGLKQALVTSRKSRRALPPWCQRGTIGIDRGYQGEVASV
jgi:hypothetical protein